MGRSRNWHDLRSPISIIRNIFFFRNLRPYYTLRVSKSLDHWCAFGTISNFEKRNLRSGHLMWPGGVIFGVIGSSFFGNVSNCWLNNGKFGGATPPFFRYLRKTWGGITTAVRGLSRGGTGTFFWAQTRSFWGSDVCPSAKMNSPLQIAAKCLHLSSFF